MKCDEASTRRVNYDYGKFLDFCDRHYQDADRFEPSSPDEQRAAFAKIRASIGRMETP